MIDIVKKEECCGCGACQQACPKQCIEFIYDNEGFNYPLIDIDDCIKCDKCVNVCPVINQAPEREPVEIFVAKSKDNAIRSESSSGGYFTELSKRVILDGGVVFGARFNAKWEVEHNFVENIDDLKYFRGSKYVQSRVGGTFLEVQKFLKSGRSVLYSGSPCQIAGLRNFLGKDYENLTLVDFVCHGVPSPKIFQLYLSQLVPLKKSKEIANITFRNKRLGWRNYSLLIEYIDDKGRQKQFIETKTKNSYLRGFLKNLSIRPSCSNCPAKSGRSCADITISDAWGLKNSNLTAIDDDKGLSAIYGFNNKITVKDIEGVDCYNDDTLKPQSVYYHSTSLSTKRNTFFDMIDNGVSVEGAINKLYPVSWKVIFKSSLYQYYNIYKTQKNRLCKKRK